MREINFRGMGVDGKFHYGNLAIIEKKIDHIEAGYYISNSVGVPFAYQVRPETVGQFTGLKDKNGKELYEGDIISNNIPYLKGNTYVVEFKYGSYLMRFIKGENPTVNGFILSYDFNLDSYEIIENNDKK